MHGLVTLRSDDPPGVPAAHAPEVVDLEERTWLVRHCRGDSSAFPALIAAYRRPVYSYLVRTGVADADRDDVFQTIFLNCHAAAASYDSSRPLAPWLFTVVANAVRSHFRARPTHLAVVAADPPADAPDPDPGPERIAEGRESVARLEAALDSLPPAQRQVLLLVTIAGLRQQDVAACLKLPLNTVKTHLRRARLTLAAGLARADAPAGGPGETDDHL